ncbi:hypothetical protein WMY93_024131 [Mugilogobius chulae]|uniref:Uncharacterized protein n=1 Tax=Mugilogobius chulae TaxID=88201 RepID=A0AAW0N661_9GOBI
MLPSSTPRPAREDSPLPSSLGGAPPATASTSSHLSLNPGATVHPCVAPTALLALKIHEVDLDTLRGAHGLGESSEPLGAVIVEEPTVTSICPGKPQKFAKCL